jgi:hypothetical protein
MPYFDAEIDIPTVFVIRDLDEYGGVRQILTEYETSTASDTSSDISVYYALTGLVSGTDNVDVVFDVGTLFSGTRSIDVDFYTSVTGILNTTLYDIETDYTVGIIKDTYVKRRDVEVDYWTGIIRRAKLKDVDVNIWVGIFRDNERDLDVDFTISASTLFNYDTDVYCSTYSGIYNVDHWELYDYVDSDVATFLDGKGGYLWPFPTDVYSSVSGTQFNFESDSYSSLCNTVPSGLVFTTSSGVFPTTSDSYYTSDVVTQSGSLIGYEQDVYATAEVGPASGTGINCDMRLNALVVDNFFLTVDEYVSSAATMSVNIYDKRQILIDTANCYFVVSGTQVPVTFSGIEVVTTDLGNPITTSGYRMYFDSPTDFVAEEPVEVLAHGANIIGDVVEHTYYLLYGYNLIFDTPPEVIWGWDKQIIVWATATNNASCPNRETDGWWFQTRPKEYADLSARIVPTGFTNLPATIYPQLVPNSFFYGAKVTVIVNARDETGNEMEPFTFEFTIVDNPN